MEDTIKDAPSALPSAEMADDYTDVGEENDVAEFEAKAPAAPSLRSIFEDSMKTNSESKSFSFFGMTRADAEDADARRALLEKPKEITRPLYEIAADIEKRIQSTWPKLGQSHNFVAGSSTTHRDWIATRRSLTLDFRRKRKAATRKTSAAKRTRFGNGKQK